MDLSSLVPDGVDSQATGFNKVDQLKQARCALLSCGVLERLPNMKGVTTLDESQLAALHRMITKELAIVQGPPGTGKTFTSVAGLKVLLDNRSIGASPIIVAAQTNHALDQLLLQCHAFGANILRVGGRSESKVMATRTAYHLRRELEMAPSRVARALEKERTAIKVKMEALFRKAFTGDKLLDLGVLLDYKVITQEQHDSIVDDDWITPDKLTPFQQWIGKQVVGVSFEKDFEYDFSEEEEIDELDDPTEMDEDFDVAGTRPEEGPLTGVWLPMAWEKTGRLTDLPRADRKAVSALDQHSDLWDIPVDYRGPVYTCLYAKLMAAMLPELQGLHSELVRIARELKIAKWHNDLTLIPRANISVVGCTTTGLTKYRGFIAAMLPRTLLVDEAAETREANVVSALYPTLQQLILIGDHAQLAPSCDVKMLEGAPYHLNVSLFERLVKVGMPYTMLNTQRRMKPELRQILDEFYVGLRDHPHVQSKTNRPDVPGMGGRNCWLVDHEWPEGSDADKSKLNRKEAEMIVKFAGYLLNNGIAPSQITILTFYNGQRKLLKNLLRKDPAINGAGQPLENVFTVDSYQGEENDIVLLSLVRSQRRDAATNVRTPTVGFLKTRNRAVVALSRARRGLYVFGNIFSILKTGGEAFQTWARVHNGFFRQQLAINGRGIPLTCQNHGCESWFKVPDDFVGNAGGCGRKCNSKRDCGHMCRLTCHS